MKAGLLGNSKTRSKSTTKRATSLAQELRALARSLEPMNGTGRSAAVWELVHGGSARVLYSGPHTPKHMLRRATERLNSGETEFDFTDEPGVSAKVHVCTVRSEKAAYGLFLQGAGTPHLAATIGQLIESAEASFGKNLSNMTRTEKQDLVRFLDDRGVFLIRKAVEEVADRLGVTRFTIYNYLDRSEG